MKPTDKCIRLVQQFEGFRSKAYICPAGKVTIGYGTTIYPNGDPVKMGDTCTKEDAVHYLNIDLGRRADAMGNLPVNSNQNDAILSFAYNEGMTNWFKSTLCKMVKQNPNDPAIRNEFYKWTKDRKNGVMVKLPGLVTRRKAEADLYFS